MRVIVCIKEFERKEMLRSVLKDIPFPFLIYDDCSTYEHDFNNYLRLSPNKGRDNHWEIWNINLFHLQFMEFDLVIFIPSDLRSINWNRIIEEAEKLQEEYYAFNIINDGRTTCWTKKKPKVLRDRIEAGFVDCIFFTNKKTLDRVGYYIQPVNPLAFKRMRSSGVGKQLSERLLALEIPCYVPNISFAYHGNHESTMHKEHRERNPLISQMELIIDKPIYVGIATFKDRKISLKRVLKCLENQTVKPTKIFVYDNEVQTDITDNGKFEPLSRITEPCYFFSCDDDLYYPIDYIESMVKAVQKHECIVTHHGRKLIGKGRNYFTGHIGYRCLSIVHNEEFIDVAGTGVTAFDTSYFNPNEIYLTDKMRMSDLVFSLEVAKQKKKIKVLPHRKDWIRQIPIPLNSSCYFREKRSPEVQNSLADEIFDLNNLN